MPGTEAEVARGLFASALARDWESVGRMLAQDVAWELGGEHPHAGHRYGRAAVVGALRSLLDGTRGSFRPVLPQTWNIEVRGHHVMLADWVGTTRGGRWLNGCLVFAIAVEQDLVSRLLVSFHDERDFAASAI